MTLYGALVDAFTAPGFRGNPAAVIHCQPTLSPVWMQECASELNQAETAFVSAKDDSVWNLRWFTPVVEVQLCGHATLAAAYWLWQSGRASSSALTFDTLSGDLSAYRNEPAKPNIELPLAPFYESQSIDHRVISRALRCEYYDIIGMTQHDDWLERDIGVVTSPETLRHLEPDLAAVSELPAGGLIVTASSDDQQFDFLSRYFGPACGIPEDHVTGSAHCSLGPYWSKRLGRKKMTACQVSHRGGVLGVEVAVKRVSISGQCRIAAEFQVRED